MKLLVSGASGFVGTALLPRLLTIPNVSVVIATRRHVSGVSESVPQIRVGELSPYTHWLPALTGIDAVVHLAARVHVMHDTAADPLAEFRQANVGGTLNFARQAAVAGVRRFVFLSSVKVNGEGGDRPYRETDVAAPQEPYGVSKHEAERGLRAISADTGMEVTMIRPPLVYGPGVKANFQVLMRAIEKGIPLPLGAVDNRRSLVAVDNLADFIATCIMHPDAGNETFLVSDGEDLSTPELIRCLARAMNRPARLFSVPPSLLAGVGTLMGKQLAVRRLCGSLWVDIALARERLGWKPLVSSAQGLARTAEWFLESQAK